ncbi:mitochondrial assembly of ribosomal large subunit protein 1 [Sphaeramia orbicularis]|uniref:Mitochondrial assembly of ribosomal large subunit protein 1 n=1 Tax=Sphaeramia orbicularis TaxID=375764 RepID=A0A672Z867_9TELE|nr:mitochondrial assembly of ribosomal large subunit protein 1 [Sphaeramia orbicularis]
MSILNRLKPLLSSVVKQCILPEQTVFLRSVCTSPVSRSHRFTTHSSTCQSRYNVFTCTFSPAITKRCYSELYNENDKYVKSTSGAIQEELQEVEVEFSDDDPRSQRSSKAFTLDVLVSLLQQENAVDICVIKVPEQIKYAEYFVVVSGLSTRHLRAMALYAIKVYKFLKKDQHSHVKIEGKDTDDWLCIDFGSMVVHFMLPETREVYELEKLWTLRSYDEQLKNMPAETLPEDFIYDTEVTK